MTVQRLKPAQVASVLRKMITLQNNKCAICGQFFTLKDHAVLDHDHDTGFLRDALHNSCNGAEGRVKSKGNLGHAGVTSADYVIALGKYLERHKIKRWNYLHPAHRTTDEKRIQRNTKARKRRAKAKVGK